MFKKSIYTCIIAFSFTASVQAQIPNPGFENWTSMGTYSNPDGWDQLNAMTTSTGVYTCTKGTPGNPGNSYIKLVSKTAGAMGVMPGVAVSGVIDMMTMTPKSGFAFNQMPVSLTGNWQYMASGADQGFVAVYLTKWNSAMMMRDTVAKALKPLTGMVMSWTAFTVNLTYVKNVVPDSGIIVLSASGSSPVANSYLYVDNLAFSGSVMGVQDLGKSNTAVNVFPNPATDHVTINTTSAGATFKMVELYDVNGKKVQSYESQDLAGKSEWTIPVSGLVKGTYLVKIMTSQGTTELKKIVIH